MKTHLGRYLLIFTLLLISNRSFATKPWGDNSGTWKIRVSLTGNKIVTHYNEFIRIHLSEQFGIEPWFVIWDGTSEPINAFVTIDYIRDAFHLGKPGGLPDTLTWTGLQPFVFWKLELVEGDSNIYVPVQGQGPDHPIVSKYGVAEESLYCGVMQNVRDLPIPSDSTVWHLTAEIWDQYPPDGNLIAKSDDQWRTLDWVIFTREGEEYPEFYNFPNLIGRTTRKSAQDSLIWAMQYRPGEEVSLSLLELFPNNEFLLESLVYHYYELEDCKNLKQYGKRLIKVIKKELDPYVNYIYNGIRIPGMVDKNGKSLPNTRETRIQLLEERIEKICE